MMGCWARAEAGTAGMAELGLLLKSWTRRAPPTALGQRHGARRRRLRSGAVAQPGSASAAFDVDAIEEPVPTDMLDRGPGAEVARIYVCAGCHSPGEP